MLSLVATPLSFAGPAARAPQLRVSMQAEMAPPEPEPLPTFNVKDMPGITGPLGFFDPVGFSADASEGKIKFYREVELKHGRVAMLASLGFVVAESFHPLWGGKIDVPSYIAFQETPLQEYWKATVAVIGVLELASVDKFVFPLRSGWKDGTQYFANDMWTLK